MSRESYTFNPVAYSIEENKFLIEHLGNPPEVVEMDSAGQWPVGVNPAAVRPIIEQVYRFEQQKEHRGTEWVGVEAVKEAARIYVREHTQWTKDHLTRRGPKLPTLMVWDERGRGHKGAVGADGNTVTTYFDENGERQKLAIELTKTGEEVYKPSWIKKAQVEAIIPKLVEDTVKGTIQCPICFHTQQYDPDQRSTYNQARSRMAKHLVSKTLKDPDKHREIYTQEFSSADAVVE